MRPAKQGFGFFEFDGTENGFALDAPRYFVNNQTFLGVLELEGDPVFGKLEGGPKIVLGVPATHGFDFPSAFGGFREKSIETGLFVRKDFKRVTFEVPSSMTRVPR